MVQYHIHTSRSVYTYIHPLVHLVPQHQTHSFPLLHLSHNKLTVTECVPGYTRTYVFAAQCHPCPLGTYKPGPNSNECTPCPPGTTTNMTAATSADDCGKWFHVQQTQVTVVNDWKK